MTTRPTDTPSWATAPIPPTTDVVEPPDGLQLIGWKSFEKPPAGFVNWAWNRFSDWVAHFASSASVFPTLQAAARAPLTAPLVVGDSCLIDEADGGTPGDITVASLDAVIVTVRSLDVDGNAVAIAGEDGALTDRVRIVERDGTGFIQEPTLTNAVSGFTRVLMDGVDLVVVYTDGTTVSVECFDIATNTSKWVVTPLVAASIAFDVAWDDARVYLVSTNPNGELVALSRTTGATLYTYNHSGVAVAALSSVATDGKLVFVQGQASGHASGATIRGIVAANGFDAAGEGGLGTDAFLAWDVVQGSPPLVPGVLATDGRSLFGGSSASLVEIRGVGDGVLTASRATPTNPDSIIVDQDYLFVLQNGELNAYNKLFATEAWRAPIASFFASDGTAVFTGGSSGGDRIARGNHRPTRFRRVDPTTEKHLPLRQLLVPVEFS